MCCRDTPGIPFPLILLMNTSLFSLRTEGSLQDICHTYLGYLGLSVRDGLHLHACSWAFPWASRVGRSSDYHWSPTLPPLAPCQAMPPHQLSYMWGALWSASFHTFTAHPTASTTVSHSLFFCPYRSLLLPGFHQSQGQRVVFRAFHVLCLSGLFLFFCSFLVTQKDERRKNMIE